MMYEWFECKVKYERTTDDGSQKRVSEPYLVDAVSFTEAERRITEEMKPFISGDFTVTDIKRARYAELFEADSTEADKWYRSKLAFITIDEKSGKEKRTTQTVLVQGASLPDALQRLQKGMSSSMVDYAITAIDETALMDVFHYKELPPEGFKPVAAKEEE